MERNSAAARHSWARQHAWLLLNFLPFPVGQTIYAHCSAQLPFRQKSCLVTPYVPMNQSEMKVRQLFCLLLFAAIIPEPFKMSYLGMAGLSMPTSFLVRPFRRITSSLDLNPSQWRPLSWMSCHVVTKK